nr:NADH dehydrogenase [ubiquinone] 1 beta subcomplex subunit 6-like [Dasypus novemcinctus]
MSGCVPVEKLRLQQLQELRRRWLKEELSPGEPVLPPRKVWPVEEFWNKFLQNKFPRRSILYKPYAIVERKPRIFPGDIILETGEVVLPMKQFPDQHH